jgi:hypothetical protein
MGDKMNPLARTIDPETSHDAAIRAASFSASHQRRILYALLIQKKFNPGWGGLTAHEMEKLTRLSYVQIDRRMHELYRPKNNGTPLVKKSGIIRPTPSGGKAIVWSLI